MKTEKIFYVENVGSFFRIVEPEDNTFKIQYAPASSDIPSCYDTEWSELGYMGNVPPKEFMTVREAEMFIKGLKFESNL